MAGYEQTSSPPAPTQSQRPVVPAMQPSGRHPLALPFSPDDFRGEIKRMRRNRILITVLCIVLGLLVIAAIVGVVVYKMPGSLYTVGTNDMKPALAQGQVVLTEAAQAPAKDDIVVFRVGNDVGIKRIAAKGGEWVNIASNGDVVVSDTTLQGNAGAGALNGDAKVLVSRQVPQGQYFMTSDGVAGTPETLTQTDSFTTDDNILGKVTYRIWPPTDVSAIN